MIFEKSLEINKECVGKHITEYELYEEMKNERAIYSFTLEFFKTTI